MSRRRTAKKTRTEKRHKKHEGKGRCVRCARKPKWHLGDNSDDLYPFCDNCAVIFLMDIISREGKKWALVKKFLEQWHNNPEGPFMTEASIQLSNAHFVIDGMSIALINAGILPTRPVLSITSEASLLGGEEE